MWRFLRSDSLLAFILALFCGVAGFVIGRDPASARNLRNEVARLSLELDRISGNQGGRPTLKLQTPQQVPTSAASVTSALAKESQAWKEWAKSREGQLNEWWVNNVAADRDESYTSMMSELGMDPETLAHFKAELKDLHRKAIVAGDPLFDLALARSAYDEKIRSALGDQNYELYRAYESRLPAAREYDLLQTYAKAQHSLDLDPNYASQIVDLIYASGATTTETWHGPYDPLPRPAAGTNQIIPRRTADYNDLVNKSAGLMDAAAEANIPEDCRELLREYYNMKVQELSLELANLRKPFKQIAEETVAADKKLVDEMISRGEIQWFDGSRR